MSRFTRHALANLSGQVTVSAIQVVMIPQYVGFVGVEAWGLFGFYVTVQAFAQLLDFGMSATVNRQLARYSVRSDEASDARDFVRTSEIGYCAVGLAIGATLFVSAPYIAQHWFRLVVLRPAEVSDAIRVIALLTAVQWPLTFYQGALLGMNRHATVNVVRVCATLASAAGAVVLLAWVSPAIGLFFRWQLAMAVVQVAACAVLVWRALPPSTKPARFNPASVRSVLRFAYGMTAVTATATLLSQLDRVVLTRLVALDQFGYYTLGAVAGQGLSTLVAALFATMFPMFSRLVASNDVATLRHQYVRMWGVMTALTIPVAAVVSIFSVEVLRVWTGDEVTARIAAPVAALLVTGSALNGLMTVAYGLQLAWGETGLAVRLNLLLCAFAVPALLVLPQRYGLVGAAIVWPALNAVYLAVGAVATGRLIPLAEPSRWMARVMIVPAAGCGLAVAILRLTMPLAATRPVLAAQVGAVWVVALGVVIIANRDLFADVTVMVARWRHAGRSGTGGAPAVR